MAPLQRVKRPNRLVGFDDDCMPSSLSVGLQYGINAAYGHIAVRSPQYDVRKTLHHNMYGVLKLMLRTAASVETAQGGGNPHIA